MKPGKLTPTHLAFPDPCIHTTVSVRLSSPPFASDRSPWQAGSPQPSRWGEPPSGEAVRECGIPS